MEVRSRMKLDYLPDDALYEILGHLNTKKDIEHVLVVNKKWYLFSFHSSLLTSGSLWFTSSNLLGISLKKMLYSTKIRPCVYYPASKISTLVLPSGGTQKKREVRNLLQFNNSQQMLSNTWKRPTNILDLLEIMQKKQK